MKNKILLLWIGFIVCVCITVGLWFAVNKSNPTYEEVQVTVLNAQEKKVKNKKNGSTYTTYQVEVEYEGKEYDLENAHSISGYLKGKSVKAYLANNHIYANIEGVKNGTMVGKAYFVFLIGSFILLFSATIESSKAHQKKNEE